MGDLNNLIGEELKRLRKEKKLTQAKLSNLTGLSLVTINKAERTGKMRLSTYHKIVKILHL